LYERISARVKRDPHALDPAPAPPGDRERIARLVGRWACHAHVFATPTTPERDAKEPEHQHFELDPDGDLASVDDTSAATPWRTMQFAWDGRARRWVQASVQSDAFGVVTSPGWMGDRLILEGRMTIVGEPTWLRQTYVLVDADHYTLLNEELGIARDPVPLDTYRCERDRSGPDAARTDGDVHH
jgi:hypothetical protein